jgi:DNA-binding XRE family transcriptional regulator
MTSTKWWRSPAIHAACQGQRGKFPCSKAAKLLRSDELDAYLAAATPLAYWRRRAGRTQAVLAAEAGMSEPFLAQIERAECEAGVGVMARIARALGGGRLEDLVV